MVNYDGHLLTKEARTFVDDIRLTIRGHSEEHRPLVGMSKVIILGAKANRCIVSAKSTIIGSKNLIKKNLQGALEKFD